MTEDDEPYDYWSDAEVERREQAERAAEEAARHRCPKCRAGDVKAHSAAEDRCSNPRCDYVFRYASAYPDDKEGNALRERPLSELYPGRKP